MRRGERFITIFQFFDYAMNSLEKKKEEKYNRAKKEYIMISWESLFYTSSFIFLFYILLPKLFSPSLALVMSLCLLLSLFVRSQSSTALYFFSLDINDFLSFPNAYSHYSLSACVCVYNCSSYQICA